MLANFGGSQSYVRDDLIAATIAVIFLDFYNHHNENVCFYICDSADGRQHVRKRKFDMWFSQYNRGAFMKIDEEIIDADGTIYPGAIIMKRANSYRLQIIEAFISLIDSFNNEK